MSTNKNKKQALGKGIRALLNTIDDEMQDSSEEKSVPPSVSGQNTGTITRIPVEQIVVNPKQPRRDFDEQALKELSESILLHDIIQPVTVVKINPTKYQLVSGERRWRASKLAGLKDIPAYIRTADDQQLLEMALLENLQREDLNAIEIGLSYRRLMDECDMTQEEVAERMKKDRSTVTNYLRILRLPPDVQKAVRDGQLSMGHARAIIGLEQVDQQLYVFREVKEKGLSVRQTEKLVKDMTTPDSKSASSKKNKEKLPPAYKRIEDNMASYFSTKVKMERKNNGKGSILIEYYNDDDLDRIIKLMDLN